jgi:hypothetical protein
MTREITLDDIESLAVGAWILGTGGGGSPYLGLLNMRRLYAEGHRVALMSPFDLADDDRVAVVSNMGAPLVGQERLADSRNIARAVQMQEEHHGWKFRAVMSLGRAPARWREAARTVIISRQVPGTGLGNRLPGHVTPGYFQAPELDPLWHEGDGDRSASARRVPVASSSTASVLVPGFDLRVLHGLDACWIGEVCPASGVNARMEHSRRSKIRIVAGLRGS